MRLALLPLILACLPVQAQWTLQDSHTDASLRGIHALGNGIAWASGSNGTILKTENQGVTWQRCTTPPNAEKLDFRGIQAFDAKTAIVMSSGKGDLSRLYKTTDGCKTWKLIFTNPDKEGFWDALQFAHTMPGLPKHEGDQFGTLIGDPVDRHFSIFLTFDQGDHWERQIRESPESEPTGEAIFAASNSSLAISGPQWRTFITGGLGGPRILTFWVGGDDTMPSDPLKVTPGAKQVRLVYRGWIVEQLPVKHSSESSGAFSLVSDDSRTVVVGGDFTKPSATNDTAWYQGNFLRWVAAQTPPHGHRSSVAYDPTTRTWITVGPNGTDISTDDGRNWRALKPTPNEAPDADQHWNALSLPFVVGPHGRIGRLTTTKAP